MRSIIYLQHTAAQCKATRCRRNNALFNLIRALVSRGPLQIRITALPNITSYTSREKFLQNITSTLSLCLMMTQIGLSSQTITILHHVYHWGMLNLTLVVTVIQLHTIRSLQCTHQASTNMWHNHRQGNKMTTSYGAENMKHRKKGARVYIMTNDASLVS